MQEIEKSMYHLNAGLFYQCVYSVYALYTTSNLMEDDSFNFNKKSKFHF